MGKEEEVSVVKELEEFAKHFKECVQDALDKGQGKPRSSMLLDDTETNACIMEACFVFFEKMCDVTDVGISMCPLVGLCLLSAAPRNDPMPSCIMHAIPSHLAGPPVWK